MSSVGRCIKKIRKDMGMRQWYLAKMSGISPTYLSRIEKGQIKVPRDETLSKISNVLNVSVEALLEGRVVKGGGPRGVVSVPYVNEKAIPSGMTPIEDSNILDWIDLPESMLGNRRNVDQRFVIKEVIQCSLEPKLRKGELVVLDRSYCKPGRPIRKGVYLFHLPIDGFFYCKQSGEKLICSNNEGQLHDIPVLDAMIVGKVIIGLNYM